MKNDSLLKRLKGRIAGNGPGLTVAVVAMLIALTGGAFAASGALTAKQKKEVKKIAQTEAKKFATAGPAGPQGSPGGKGDKGDRGEKGSQGDSGSPGAPGKSVAVSEIPSGEPLECDGNGGALVQEAGAASGIEVCTGKAGVAGKEGQPWTPNNTLPAGATEAGTWAFNGTEADTSGVRVPISFPVKFPFNIKSEHVHFGTAGEGGAFTAETGLCPASSAFNPKAALGELCIYSSLEQGLVNATFDGAFRLAETIAGAVPAGALLKFTPSGVAYGAGSFAVTACARETPAEEGEPKCPPGY